MTVHTSWTLDALVGAYEQHLDHVHGLRSSTVERYVVPVRRFLRAALGDDPIDITRLVPGDAVDFILGATSRFRPRTVGLVVTALRSFFRFLRAKGLSDGRLEAAVPSVAQWRLAALPRGLTDEQLTRLFAVASASTGRYAARARAILTCVSSLGLRPGEVADLRLDDIDWHVGTLHIRPHKTRRGTVLPLPRALGSAIIAYLRAERPATTERRVFVQHHRAARGAPMDRLAVTHVVGRALKRAGIETPIRGAYVLRHTLASRMVRRGTSLKEVADILGHRSLDTTAIYAKLDLPTLREVALPWPEVTP